MVSPRCPIFPESDKRISILGKEYSDNFKVFYAKFINDIMVGRFLGNGGKFLLPVFISVHHPTCDVYHVSKFFSEFQNLALNFNNIFKESVHNGIMGFIHWKQS